MELQLHTVKWFKVILVFAKSETTLVWDIFNGLLCLRKVKSNFIFFIDFECYTIPCLFAIPRMLGTFSVS